MLNIFPIQYLAPIAYLILRVGVGIILIRLGFSHIKHREALKEVLVFSFFPYRTFIVWYLALIEIGIGALFLLGLFTQVAALLAIAYSIKFIILHKKLFHPLIPEQKFYVLLFVISLSLFITGAGILAFDLPI